MTPIIQKRMKKELPQENLIRFNYKILTIKINNNLNSSNNKGTKTPYNNYKQNFNNRNQVVVINE